MVEVACAYMEQCTGIESFYDSFQEKVQGSTLYILTISSVTIMPFQLLTGLFGMNFADPDGDGPASEQMAELYWEYGYMMFWIGGCFLTGIILLLMHRKVRAVQHTRRILTHTPHNAPHPTPHTHLARTHARSPVRTPGWHRV
jgi:Mg2+ and Co2+ transporter CorA